MSTVPSIYKKEMEQLQENIVTFPDWSRAGDVDTTYFSDENRLPASTVSFTAPTYRCYLLITFDMPLSGAVNEGFYSIKLKINNKEILVGTVANTDHWYDHASAGMMLPLKPGTKWSITDPNMCKMMYQYVPMV